MLTGLMEAEVAIFMRVVGYWTLVEGEVLDVDDRFFPFIMSVNTQARRTYQCVSVIDGCA
jgi:hypothetical protein